MQSVLAKYVQLLEEVDAWFARCMATVGTSSIVCGSGCTGCCRGLFDITLLDAFLLKTGFDKMQPIIKKAVLAKVEDRLSRIQAVWPDFNKPYLLNYRPEDEWDRVMPDEDETPCVLLDGQGQCLLYNYRPMTCRLHGLPLVDTDGEVFHEEWCSLNFVEQDPLQLEELRWEFRRLFADELEIFREFTEELTGEAINELDTLIPTALLLDITKL
jgi:Fe-S-cluster containining protein